MNITDYKYEIFFPLKKYETYLQILKTSNELNHDDNQFISLGN